jgi:hypothetical protein
VKSLQRIGNDEPGEYQRAQVKDAQVKHGPPLLAGAKFMKLADGHGCMEASEAFVEQLQSDDQFVRR